MQLGRSPAQALVEIIPNRWLKQSVYILNVYSPPSEQRQTFHSILAKASSLARGSPLVVAGDFNAAHTVWGYKKQTAKLIILVPPFPYPDRDVRSRGYDTGLDIR